MMIKSEPKKNKCIICSRQRPKTKRKNKVTCGKDCSKVYTRISKYCKYKFTSKYILEIKELKLKLKQVMENAN